MQDNFQILIRKLDGFIRKYYTNKLIRGLILGFSLTLLAWLLALLLDYAADFGKTGRQVLFFSWCTVFLYVLAVWIINPLVRYFRLGRIISHEQAARIIGRHFPGVNDKVINTLQLRKQAELSETQLDLLQAGIDQKITELKPISFTAAIDLRRNRRYLRFALPPLLVMLVLLFAAPSLLTEGTRRIVQYDQEFEKQAPFRFVLETDKLEVAELEDFRLVVKMEGEAVPDAVFLETGAMSYRMEALDKRRFAYTFRKVNKNQQFKLTAAGFHSPAYELKTIPNPTLLRFDIHLRFPAYTGIAPKTVSNDGDLSVPEGTVARWVFHTRSTEELLVTFADTLLVLKPSASEQFALNTPLIRSGAYSIRTRNRHHTAKDSVAYYLNVVPDQYPRISVEEQQDSLSQRRRYFMGEISDDYALTSLTFHYRFLNPTDSLAPAGIQSVQVPFNRGASADQFIYFWDLSSLPLQPGDQVEYYFIVTDNDGIRGPKATRSATRVFKAPTLREIGEQNDKSNDALKKDMEKALEETRKLNRETKQIKQEMLQKKNLGWQEKNKLENLMERQQQLQQRVDQIRRQNQQQNNLKNEFTQPNPELFEKQQQLEEMFEKLMSEDMKKLYDELQQLLEKLDKNKLQENLDQVELSQKDLEKELDRSLELFRQLEFDQKLGEISDKLEKLAEEQQKLSEETAKNPKENAAQQQKQEELNKEFEKLREDMEKLRELNEELERKHDLGDTREEEQQIENQMQQSSEQLSQQKSKKASDSQKKAAEDMQSLQQQLEAMQQSAEEEQMGEDIDAMRALLENLVRLSIDQEALMTELTRTAPNDPKYVKLGQQQRKLKDDARMIEDSLFALSKRVMQIQPIVNKEMAQINQSITSALREIGERRTPAAASQQQYAMTALNNLALLLDEALQAMQAQLAASQSNPDGSCKKPGSNKGSQPKPGKGQSMQSLKKMQEELSKTMEQVKKQLEKEGNKKGPGQGNPSKDGQLSRELAEMAAKQEAIRRKLMELGNELNKDGSGNGNEIRKIAEQMERNEEDIVNRRITQQTLMRQQDILTRLLESEKAVREREMDEKRQSEEAKDQERSNSLRFLEYKRKKEKELELLRTIPPSLTPYYKNRVNDYFNTIGK